MLALTRSSRRASSLLGGSDAALAAGTAALEARARARAADLKPIIAEMQAAGRHSLGKIAAELTARRVPAARGGAWSRMQVSRVLALID
jgi:hypothetical protein